MHYFPFLKFLFKIILVFLFDNFRHELFLPLVVFQFFEAECLGLLVFGIEHSIKFLNLLTQLLDIVQVIFCLFLEAFLLQDVTNESRERFFEALSANRLTQYLVDFRTTIYYWISVVFYFTQQFKYSSVKLKTLDFNFNFLYLFDFRLIFDQKGTLYP